MLRSHSLAVYSRFNNCRYLDATQAPPISLLLVYPSETASYRLANTTFPFQVYYLQPQSQRRGIDTGVAHDTNYGDAPL